MPLSVMRIMPIGKSGTLAETLGTVQPFRYRGYVLTRRRGCTICGVGTIMRNGAGLLMRTAL